MALTGSRDSKFTDVAYISEYICDEWNGNDCDAVVEDLEVYGTSEVTIGDNTRFDQETFYADDFKCPKCGVVNKYMEIKVG